MTAKQEMGRTLYDALLAGDQDALRGLLADGFVGDLTPGLPNGYGEHTYGGPASPTSGVSKATRSRPSSR